MNVEELVRQYLPQVKIMQLATVADGKPYLCTVHYYSDADLNFYWTSLATRHHSQEIEQNAAVAAYVLVHENTPEEDYVTGITIVGQAELRGSDVGMSIIQAYANKLDKESNFAQSIVNEQVPHKFYRLRPEKIVMFDNKNFPDNPRQELLLK